MAHNQHHMAGSKPITHGLQNQEGSRCMCGVGRKKQSRVVRGAHGSIAGHQHTWKNSCHTTSTTLRAASQSLTGCRIRKDPDACVGQGERKQSRVFRGADASIASQQHTWNTTGHITSTTLRAASQSLTGCRIRKDPDACVGQGERKQSRVFRGADASIASQQHTWNTTGHITSTTLRAASQSLTSCRIRRDQEECVGYGERKQSRVVKRGTWQHSQPATHMEQFMAHSQHHMAGSKPITHMLQNQEGSRCMCGVG